MSDETPSIEQSPPQVARMEITFDLKSGVVQVSYPRDQVVCNHMLREATKLIDAEWAKHMAPKIVPGTNGVKGALRPFGPMRRG